MNIQNCTSIDEVRSQIDRLDAEIVKLITERGLYVKQAASFKKTATDVKAPQRVEQVIEKVRTLAENMNGNPAIIEGVYRTMISCFIEAELQQHAALNQEDAS